MGSYSALLIAHQQAYGKRSFVLGQDNFAHQPRLTVSQPGVLNVGGQRGEGAAYATAPTADANTSSVASTCLSPQPKASYTLNQAIRLGSIPARKRLEPTDYKEPHTWQHYDKPARFRWATALTTENAATSTGRTPELCLQQEAALVTPLHVGT